MSTPNTNPFILPGLGQDASLSGNPLLASMEMMGKAWAGLAGPGGLAQSLPITPPMNLEDLERRIAELRSVENWLRMNLSMLSGTIQGMEVQRSTIATLRSFVAGASGDGPSPLEIVLGLKPASEAAPRAPASAEGRPSSSTEPPSASTGDAAASSTGADAANMADQVNQASQAWWGLLQQQFNQIATATAATMPDASAKQAAAQPAATAPDACATPPVDAAPRKRAPRKTAAKRASTTRKP